MEQLRRGVMMKRGEKQSEGIASAAEMCRGIGMSGITYRRLKAGESSNLRNYLRAIFWCIDRYPSGRREQLMLDLAMRLRREFE